VIENISGIRKQLSELAAVLNEFKSEAVQLRILDLVFGKDFVDDSVDQPEGHKPTRGADSKPTPKPRKAENVAPSKRRKASGGTGANATLNQLLGETSSTKPAPSTTSLSTASTTSLAHSRQTNSRANSGAWCAVAN
jgi:hypothetical protein